MGRLYKFLPVPLLFLVILPVIILQHTTVLKAAGISISEFNLPTGNGGPSGITTGPDGGLWFTELSNGIGRISTSGAVTEYPVPTAASGPKDIASGPDGNLWFTENYVGKIGRISPSGVVSEYPIPTANSGLADITAGPDGKMWFTELGSSKVASITMNGVITEFQLPNLGSEVTGITKGPDGNIWFTESGAGANNIGRITPAGVITEFPIPTSNAGASEIATGPDGNLWFTEYVESKIGRITPVGIITEFPIPVMGSEPSGITAGPDGNMWFTESGNSTNDIGQITPDGIITEYPAANNTLYITTGPDGNLWYTEYWTEKIARVNLNGIPPSPTPSPTVSPTLTPSPTPTSCPALQFYGVMGSGEWSTYNKYGLYGHTITVVKDVLKKRFPSMGTQGINYPAVPVLQDWLNYGSTYLKSVGKGITALSNSISKFTKSCPNSFLILAGYSQGAQVVGDVFDIFDSFPNAIVGKIVAVIMFGDPRFNPKQPKVDFGLYDKTLSGSFQSIDSHMRQIPPRYVHVVHSYCLLGDPICNFSAHNVAMCLASPNCSHYLYWNGWAEIAAEWAMTMVPSPIR